jgi:hypothetical protein
MMPVPAETEEQAAESEAEAAGRRNFLRMMRYFSACFRVQAG